MGFALELDNAGNFGLPDVGRSRSPRHRKPPRRHRPQVGGLARRARTVLAARPALADHRRAF
jgi:hypothetical protein